jgi:hypothetical protein
MVRRVLCAGIVVLCLGAFAGPVVVQADTGEIIAPQNTPANAEDGWQAGTCKVEPCSPETPGAFFTQAAGHPPIGFTQFIVKHTVGPIPGTKTPVGKLKDVRVDLPVGLSVNPQATPQCDLATFTTNAALCPPTSQVGLSLITAAVAGVPGPPVPAQVYNLVPNTGEPALFGFSAVGSNVFLKSDVDWSGDYHEGFTIAVPEAPLGALILQNRLVFTGNAGNGTFLTTPSTCYDPAQPAFAHTYSTFLRADSVEAPNPTFPSGSSRLEASLPPGVKPTGCNLVPFKPGIGVTPATDQTDSPDGTTVEVTLPFEPAQPLANSDIRTARTSLPRGMGLNPSAANGLVACTDAQLGKGTRAAVACPPASKIGTVSVNTPPLPDGSVTGSVFLGKQLSRDPTSGQEYRIFVDAESARYGISARLIGNVAADPKTGKLTATLADNPQVPISSFKIQLNAGPRAPLTSPPTCGPNESTSAIDPYTGTPQANPTTKFDLAKAPGGGPCAKSLAARPFTPGFAAGAASDKAGAYSPFAIHLSRADGQQELKLVDVTLPPGISGKLKGIPYCSASDIAAAAGRAGESEAKKPSCSSKSLVGAATVTAGSGPSPVQIKGQAYLAGPYKGAPLSLAVITPAVTGPFDLGVVVVRVALFVDPYTAQIRPYSDQIPDVFGGAKLDIRSIDVNANRKEFTINPTSCGKLETTGSVKGGGSDPTSEAAFSSFPVLAPFQPTDCGALKFRPKLFTKVISGRKSTVRAQNPKFRATLVGRDGDANLRQAVVTLPKALILDQSHIKKICTRPELAAGACPKSSIYGNATATSPLLGKQLTGPVYLVPSTHVLPDLLVDLRGQVEVRLRASTESVKSGRLRNVFYSVPDVPVSKFVLTIKGGKKGLLLNTTDLCARKLASKATLKSQNGKKLRKKKLKLQVPACHKGRHHKK